MKKLKRLIGALSMLAVLVVVLTACGSRQSLSKQDVLTNDKASKTITWGVKADTKLFGLMDVKDNTIKGFDADIARALTKRVLGKDATAKFVQVTSQTRIPLLKNGNIDAIIATMTITPEREKQVDFTDSYFDAGQSLLVKKGSSIKSVKDLNKTGTKVLGVTGANSIENIKKVAPKAKVLELSDYAQAMTALKSGQGVALTTDNGILYGMAAQNPGYEVVGGTFTKEPYGIAVNKGQTPLKKELNKALKEIEADGTYNRILKKWFGNVAGFDYKEASR
ncbi:transporter substrate-binding domain-containing protein [Lactiplantibacillus pentosus]|uniref:Glutamine ABC transporter substrate-binding protein n=1 Tax=Lactiplantibacillus pentosus TaxID=1589 RepID=A0AB37RN44_LACPE|nr:transporter substrate-binding domain-containing protein [Lactiplantibacillus pentosus]RMW48677.1 glutamine ABC transporter substrate-binding protein [Lactiplantibacillus pentosus]RMW49638.1 glutamine ABC transporter substrate-binding protein [Lactiplantibacillus pentosus]RMW56759.1 glutamine ABC transporter substrate-binding protein [Lactiplantibacillus pentosus]RMW57361.1 glutamine ABC transporter substrate-binding protein [Lactiplantibacillus pentosus]